MKQIALKYSFIAASLLLLTDAKGQAYQVPSVPLVLVDAHERLQEQASQAKRDTVGNERKKIAKDQGSGKPAHRLEESTDANVPGSKEVKFVPPPVPLVFSDANQRIQRHKERLLASERLQGNLPSFVRPEKHSEMKKLLKQAKDSVRKSTPTAVAQPGRRGTSDLPRTKSGVPVFDLNPLTTTVTKGKKSRRVRMSVKNIPALDIGREDQISKSVFKLPDWASDLITYEEPQKLLSRSVFDRESVLQLTKRKPLALVDISAIDKKHGKLQKAVTLDQVAKVNYRIVDEKSVQVLNVTPLSATDQLLLTALLLYKEGKNCESVIGLFDQLKGVKSNDVQAESTYYLGICAGRLGLLTEQYNHLLSLVQSENREYTTASIHSLLEEVPYDQEIRLAQILHGLKNKNLVDSKDQDKVNYQIAKGLFKKGDYGLAQSYAQKVKTSDKNYEGAQYILSLAQVMQGQIGKALKTQEALLSRMRQKGVKGADKKSEEVKTLVAINLARTHFEKGSYSKALEYFREVDSNHPLRLSTLVELGWAQINAKDYPGAVGNMHSLHIPKYKLVYQPESHVVRTIGYLNMCQYGDAYKSLRVLEHKYKPWLDKMTAYSRVKSKSGHYDTLRRYLSQGDPLAEIDGLPPQVIREMGRQKKFINIQSSINQMDFEVGTALASVATQIRKKISLAKSIELKSQGEALRIKNRIQAGRKARKGADPVGMAEMTREIRHHENIVIQQRYLQTVFKESLLQFAKYKANVTKRINREIAQLKSSANKELALTMKDMISNLGRFLENNELLKYEVYAGAGENIRYRVAGGKGQKLRAPAAIEEIEKNMNWEFEGEVWADEVGHFRSNLKNLCPELNTAGGR